MKKASELARETLEKIVMQEKSSEYRIRCNNTKCDCYSYGSCTCDKVVINWDDKRNVATFKCDFK